jgi:hypothetical protein
MAENTVRNVLELIVLAELALLLALVIVWALTWWILGPRGITRARDACPNCGWRAVAAAQACPMCHLAPEDTWSPHHVAPPDERRPDGRGTSSEREL